MTRRTPWVATAGLLALLAAGYYGFPEAAKGPLIQLNRSLAGLHEREVHTAGHRIAYLEGGRGPTVVLLHGIFAEKDHWVDFARGLTADHRVVVPDLPGFGASDRHATARYGYAEQVERLAAFLEALGIERAHLAGSSMGGALAALYALEHPARVESLAFIGAPHGLSSRTPSPVDRLIESGEAPLVARDDAEVDLLFARLFAQRPWLPYPILASARRDAIQRAPSNLGIWRDHVVDRRVLDEQLGALALPVLALWGEEDQVFHVSGAARLTAGLRRGEVRVLPGLGHLPMMEAPRATAEVYAAFLGALSSGGPSERPAGGGTSAGDTPRASP